jgi:hypothetical protein
VARWGFNSRFVIGKQDNPMMERWRVIQTPWFGLYVHFIYREDLDPIPHDHPWQFWRMVLRGGYQENYTEWPNVTAQTHARVVRALRPSRVPTSHAHHITSVLPGTVSVVLVGPKHRTWGFWEPRLNGTSAWVDYRDALHLRPTEGARTQHYRDHNQRAASRPADADRES